MEKPKYLVTLRSEENDSLPTLIDLAFPFKDAPCLHGASAIYREIADNRYRRIAVCKFPK